MRLTTDATLLTAISKDYDFEGKQGTTHKVRLNIEGEIFVTRTDEAGIARFKSFEGKEGTATLNFTSPKERLNVSLEEFELA